MLSWECSVTDSAIMRVVLDNDAHEVFSDDCHLVKREPDWTLTWRHGRPSGS